MIGRLIERLFVQVRADMTDLSRDLSQGMSQTRAATQSMAMSWNQVSSQVELLTRKLDRGKITQGQYTSEMNQLASTMKVVAGSYREAQREVWGYASAAQAAARSSQVAMDPTPVRAFTRSAGQARMQMMNLGYQLNDIGMTLSTGMNPMTVLIQQGSQIAQIYGGQGGVNQLFKDLGKMVTGLARRFWPVALVIGAVTTGIAALTKSINQTTDVGVTMGDTFKAVFQVLGRYLYPFIEGPLNDLMSGFNVVIDFIAEWFPKVMNGVIAAGIAMVKIIGATWDLLPWLWEDAWTAIKNTAIDVIQAIANFVTQDLVNNVLKGVNRIAQAFSFAYEGVKIIWSKLPDILKDAIGGAVNWVVDGVEKLVNVAIEGINKLIAGLQSLMDFVGADAALEFFGFSGQLKPLDPADLSTWRMETGSAMSDTFAALGALAGRVFNQNMMGEMASIDPLDLSGSKGASHNAFSELGRRIGEIVGQAFQGTDYMGQFFEDVKAQAIVNAQARVAAGMEDIGTAAGGAAEEVKTLMDMLDEKLTGAAESLAEVFGSAFERLAETGRFTFGDFVQDLNRLIIKSTSEILQQELANMFKSLALSKGGLGGLFSNLFTNLFGGFNAMGARARGGTEMPWRNFIAGEEGAELISQDGPSGARRVTTAGRTRHLLNGSGGAAPVVNMYIQTPDVQSFQKSQSQLASRMGRFISSGRRNQ